MVIALAIIAAIIDIPLGALREAGMGGRTHRMSSSVTDILRGLGIAALLIAFCGAAVQSYLASTPANTFENGFALLLVTDGALLLAVVVWGLLSPLAWHWGLCLGAFGLGLALLFLSLAGVLRLDFQLAGTLADPVQRAAFSAITGVLVLAVTACLAAVLGLLAQIVRGATLLAFEHRRHRAAGEAQARVLAPSSAEEQREAGNALSALRTQRMRLAALETAVRPTDQND